MKIALIQQQATEDKQENIDRGLKHLEEAAQQGAQLAVYAELAFTCFYPQHRARGDVLMLAETVPGPTTDAFAAKAKELGMTVIINLFEREEDRTYDSSPVIDSDGTLLGVTRMVHIADYACFYEKDYYTPGGRGAPVYDTSAGKVGVAICYDRHYPEYMRALGLKGAEVVVIPQAGTVGEWPEGLYEAELQVASFQNGYYCALANRVGREGEMDFAGESFVASPSGDVLARAPRDQDFVLVTDIDLAKVAQSHARTMFYRDRRPDVYPLN